MSQSKIVFEDKFEGAEVEVAPPNWTSPSVGPKGLISKTEAGHCAAIKLGSADDGFGNLIRYTPIGEMAGKRVRLTGSVRVDNVDTAHAQLWLRFDYQDGSSDLVDNMYDRPIRSDNWSPYEVVGDVGNQTGNVVVGCMAFGEGKVLLDDVRLEILGPVPETQREEARELGEQELVNLVAFARLLGYVRYFHPSDEAAKCDWESFAIAGVRKIEGATSTTELAARLSALFAPIAPTLAVFETTATPDAHPALSWPIELERVWLRSWRHNGIGSENGDRPGPYFSKRTKIRLRNEVMPKDYATPSECWEAPLAPGLACRVPLSLFEDGKRTLPHTEHHSTEARTESLPQLTGFSKGPSGNDRATRLAAVLLGWNVFQHFYPYFDVTDVDWSVELERALKTAAKDVDELAFLSTLRALVAALDDGHGGVYHRSAGSKRPLPIAWDWIEGKLVVTAVDPIAQLNIQPGDRVLSINDVEAETELIARERFISGATPQWKRWQALQDLLLVAMDEDSELRVSRDGKEHKVRAMPLNPSTFITETRPEPITELEDSIWYVDLDRIETAVFIEHREKLERAKGIVFDLRGYPNNLDAFSFFPHLTEQRIHSAWWKVPVISLPDQVDFEWKESHWTIEPKAPYLSAKKAFLTNGHAISYAESCMGIVEHYELGEIIGGPTAGTNGNINPFTLPGNYRVVWTGMKVVKQDGSQHHGVGIQPTQPVSRTRAAVKEGRDELLEAGIRAVKGE